ncbi:MAG: MotA/TolQ/ExbB proton channel family protein, partial [Prosthecochloris sp.]|nr:MotA/TolQ/ExbB proton channel family protein [Prosthecochloris sp.]
AVVAPGISEALIATAMGLMAAIPAVVAYNHFLNKVNILLGQMESFRQDFLNIVENLTRRS